MRTRGTSHRANLGIRSLTVAAACLTLTSGVGASEPEGASVDIVTGKSLWQKPAKDAVPVMLGKTSASVKQLAARVLGERYPCSAVALTLFEPPATRDGRWEVQVRGAPTTATIALIANGAQEQQIDDSIRTLGGMPYDADRPLNVSVTITTRALAADISISTIACSVIDSWSGTPVQTLEPTIEFIWRPNGARLLGVYRQS